MPFSRPSSLKSRMFSRSSVEQKILNLVGMRLLCATGEKHLRETQIALLRGYEFKTKGRPSFKTDGKPSKSCSGSLKTKEKDDP